LGGEILNLKELREKLLESFNDNSTDVNQENINNLLLYIEAIKNTEPNEYLVDILDNRYKEKNIYVDYSEEFGGVYFSEWSKDEGGFVNLKFTILPINLLNHPKPVLSMDGDNFLDVDDVLGNDWPLKYILFDEKVFNQFMNPPKNPEFLNWGIDNPLEVKE
jgi:hypothetical protein